jgi:hypothetical protein
MRKSIVILGVLAVLLAACTSGGGDSSERKNGDTQQPGVTAVAPTTAPEPTAVPEATAESTSDGGLFGGALSPLSLLTGSMFSGGETQGLPAASGEADPSLKAALLTLEDLPSGYAPMGPGEMNFSYSTDQGGMSMMASMFSKGEATDQFPESMVMSAAVLASGDLLQQTVDELQRYNDTAELERQMQEALGSSGNMFGISFKDLRVLDASGLGDGGLGLHMVMSMDLSQLAQQFGGSMPPEADFLKDGIAFDMYVFVRGDHLLMVVSMWPGSGPAPVDARNLAEVMDGRAGASF